jgi:type II secretory ATPase GspE/PulE/Tfp pilus assembly ATPase PilB-like protein
MKTLFDDGMERVLQGSTTIEEIARVVSYEWLLWIFKA